MENIYAVAAAKKRQLIARGMKSIEAASKLTDILQGATSYEDAYRKIANL